MSLKSHIVILAGPNGAGKTTTAPFLLRDAFAVHEYVNADIIARGLSSFNPEAAALVAGRITLFRIRNLSENNITFAFAFETTLASRSFAPWLKSLAESGHDCHQIFLTLPDAETAIARVASRVRLGGTMYLMRISKGVLMPG